VHRAILKCYTHERPPLASKHGLQTQNDFTVF